MVKKLSNNGFLKAYLLLLNIVDCQKIILHGWQPRVARYTLIYQLASDVLITYG